MISFEQIPRVLESLRGEWSAVSSESCPRCFTEVQGRLIVHMHPFFLGARLMQGMRAAAGSLLMRYSRELKQVPLAFKRIQPANTHAAVVGESAYIHFLIEFTSIGFRPEVDENVIGLLGPVQSAVGANFQVLKLFNLFVHKSSLPGGSWFDREAGAWMLGDDQKLGGGGSAPQFLRVTKQMEETSGDQVVNVKGVLAAAQNEAELAASRRLAARKLRCIAAEQRARKDAIPAAAVSEAVCGSTAKPAASSSTEKRKKKEPEDGEATAALGSRPARSARQEPNELEGGAPSPGGTKKVKKVKEEEPEEDESARLEAKRLKKAKKELRENFAEPVEPPEDATAHAEERRKLKKAKKELRESVAEPVELPEDPTAHLHGGPKQKKAKKELRENFAEPVLPFSGEGAAQIEEAKRAKKAKKELAREQEHASIHDRWQEAREEAPAPEVRPSNIRALRQWQENKEKEARDDAVAGAEGSRKAKEKKEPREEVAEGDKAKRRRSF